MKMFVENRLTDFITGKENLPVSCRSTTVQQLYYTELRQKVLRSQSHHQEALFFQLAASALQADVGDLAQGEETEEDGEEKKQEKKHRCYFLPEDYFPSWVKKTERKRSVV